MKPCGSCIYGNESCTWRNVTTAPPTCRVIYVVIPEVIVWPE